MLSIKRYLPQTLFGRALVIIIAPVILVQLVAAFVFYDRVWHTVTRRLTHAVAGEIAYVIQAWARYPEAENRQWTLAMVAITGNLDITFERGAILANTESPPSGTMLERRFVQALEERVRRPFVIDVWSRDKEARVDVQIPDGVLHVRVPLDRLFTSTVYVLLLWMIGSSLIFLAVASVFMRNQVRSIERLAQAAEGFGKGHDMPGFKPSGAAEVRQAAAAFVMMRERIRRFLSQRTEMLAGVSHDLRTPITRMKLELAMLPHNPSIDGLKTDVAEMERMVESYLAFVRGEGEEQPEPTDLAPMLDDIAATAQRNGHSVALNKLGDLHLVARPNAIKRCFDNLVANATRHAAQVTIDAERRPSSIEVMIDDDGPGIPADVREEVFKPFFRLDASRNPATGGVGLGLTIARDVVRSHGGDIILSDSPLGGLRARIRLPV